MSKSAKQLRMEGYDVFRRKVYLWLMRLAAAEKNRTWKRRYELMAEHIGIMAANYEGAPYKDQQP